MGSYQCDSESNLNIDDHCVVPGPAGRKARIWTLGMTDVIFAISSVYLPRVGKPPCHIPALGDFKSSCRHGSHGSHGRNVIGLATNIADATP